MRLDALEVLGACLTKLGLKNHTGDHANAYRDFLTYVDTGVFHARSIGKSSRN